MPTERDIANPLCGKKESKENDFVKVDLDCEDAGSLALWLP
jgi:hypothetical protein